MARRTKLTEREKARIVELLDEGMTQKQVAERLGISSSLVSYYANRGKVGQHGGARPGAGRGKLPAGQRRSKTVSIRFTPGQYRKLQTIAAGMDTDVSTFLYDAILTALGMED